MMNGSQGFGEPWTGLPRNVPFILREDYKTITHIQSQAITTICNKGKIKGKFIPSAKIQTKRIPYFSKLWSQKGNYYTFFCEDSIYPIFDM